MKYVLTFSFFLALFTPQDLDAQGFQDETSFLTVDVPDHFIKKLSVVDVSQYESKINHAILTLSKEYKGLEDSFLSAQSAASFSSQMLGADPNNSEVNMVHEKVGRLQFSILSWSVRGEHNKVTNCMRAFNDDGEFIHQFEMSSYNSTMEQLNNAFRAFLKDCKPIKR